MSSQGLRKQARQGLMWGGGFRLFHIGLNFGSSLVLARLLSASDYGTYSVVAGIVGFINAISFENFARHLLQVRDPEGLHYQDHFTAAIGLQSAIFLLTNLVALLLRGIPTYAEIAGYIHFMSPIIVLGSLGGFHYICLEKELNWSRYRTLQSIGVLLTAVSVLTIAWMGFGVIALLVGPMAKYLPPTVDLLCIQKWRPTWQFSWDNYRPSFYFGLNRLYSSAGAKFRSVIESNWLLQLIGLTDLGLMNRAISFSQLINSELSMVVGQSLYPVLTRIEPASPRYRDASTLLFQGMTWILVPWGVLASILARPIISTLYGDQWTACVAFVPITMLTGIVASFGRIGYQLTLAGCQENRCAAYDSFRTVLTVVALALWPLHQSLPVYLWTVVCSEVLCSSVLIVWLCQSNAASAQALAASCLPSLIAVAAASLACIPICDRINDLHLFSPEIVVCSFAFFSVYLFVLLVFFRARSRNLLQALPIPRSIRLLRASPQE